MAVMEIHISPIGTSDSGMHALIARCVHVANMYDLNLQITPMGTILEGPGERLLEVAGRMHNAALSSGAPRVITSVRLDERKGREVGLQERVREVEESLKLM